MDRVPLQRHGSSPFRSRFGLGVVLAPDSAQGIVGTSGADLDILRRNGHGGAFLFPVEPQGAQTRRIFVTGNGHGFRIGVTDHNLRAAFRLQSLCRNRPACKHHFGRRKDSQCRVAVRPVFQAEIAHFHRTAGFPDLIGRRRVAYNYSFRCFTSIYRNRSYGIPCLSTCHSRNGHQACQYHRFQYLVPTRHVGFPLKILFPTPGSAPHTSARPLSGNMVHWVDGAGAFQRRIRLSIKKNYL